MKKIQEKGSYCHEHKGIKKISWREFHNFCKHLAEKISKQDFDIIIGISEQGLYPGTLIAGMIRKEFYPIRLTSRENDIVQYKKPIWKVDMPDIVRNKNILIVDEICVTGETLILAVKRAVEKGAIKIKTAVLVAHSHGRYMPDYISLKTDQLVIFPWDTQILVRGKWRLHPEIEEKLKALD